MLAAVTEAWQAPARPPQHATQARNVGVPYVCINTNVGKLNHCHTILARYLCWVGTRWKRESVGLTE